MKKEKCLKCGLGNTCFSTQNDQPGWGNPDAKLVILLDSPGDDLAEKLLIWILRRLSLTSEDVWIDYLVKCHITDKKPKKDFILSCYKTCWNHVIRNEVFNAGSVVVAGNWGVKALTEKDMKVLHGKKDEESEIWCCYSFKYLLMNPAECVDNWRVLYKAAEEAGLHPKMDTTVEPFKFPSRKLV